MNSFSKHETLIVRQGSPFNGGPPPSAIVNNFITPTKLFFVRNHGDVPAIQPDENQLTIDGLIHQPLTFTLDDLKTRFPSRSVTATLQCAGNRRAELNAVEAIPDELAWGCEAVSTAEWKGIPLSAVLEAAGVTAEAGHVAFIGQDETERRGQRIQFGGSIALDKALRPEVLLAYEMNGLPLPAAHGYPLRVVVPGFVGVRSVKWLSRITVQAEPSSNYFQSVVYRLFGTYERADTVNVEAGLMLSEQNVNAVICEPGEGAHGPVGELLVQGYALSGGGRHIARVDVSADGGLHWQAGEVESPVSQWAWQHWKVRLSVRPGPNQIVVRAVDSAANIQPEDLRSVWNFKGYMNNAWHRVMFYAD